MAADEHFIVGADENGLGPMLGPMIVTAVLARVTTPALTTVRRKARGKLRERLGDSKGLLKHGSVDLGEAWTRVLVERGAGRQAKATSRSALADAVSLDDVSTLRKPCPQNTEAQCWTPCDDDALLTEGVQKLLPVLRRDLDRLENRGIRIEGVRCAIVCAKRLNLAAAEGRNRFVVDLHEMERLIENFRKQAGQDVSAVCGKVGGFGKYEPAFGRFKGRVGSVICEKRRQSTYAIDGIGTVSFEMDCDDRHLLVGLASLVGKFVREQLMGQISSFYRQHDPSLPTVSGYHDPVTKRFALAATPLRTRLKIADDCFARRAVGK